MAERRAEEEGEDPHSARFEVKPPPLLIYPHLHPKTPFRLSPLQADLVCDLTQGHHSGLHMRTQMKIAELMDQRMHFEAGVPPEQWPECALPYTLPYLPYLTLTLPYGCPHPHPHPAATIPITTIRRSGVWRPRSALSPTRSARCACPTICSRRSLSCEGRPPSEKLEL